MPGSIQDFKKLKCDTVLSDVDSSPNDQTSHQKIRTYLSPRTKPKSFCDAKCMVSPGRLASLLFLLGCLSTQIWATPSSGDAVSGSAHLGRSTTRYSTTSSSSTPQGYSGGLNVNQSILATGFNFDTRKVIIHQPSYSINTHFGFSVAGYRAFNDSW